MAVVFLGFISYLALKEYLSLVPTRRIDREVLLFADLAIPIQFYWAAIDWYNMFIVLIPVLAIRLALWRQGAEDKGFSWAVWHAVLVLMNYRQHADVAWRGLPVGTPYTIICSGWPGAGLLFFFLLVSSSSTSPGDIAG